MSALPSGRHFFRGDDGYEQARRATIWNQHVPERYPEVIVAAHDADDVVATIAYAKANGRQIGIRSGGHSWAANHLRDGGVLLDVHGLDHSSIDAERKVAVVGPGKGGSVLADEIYTWARSISAEVDRRVEVQMVASRTVPNAEIDRPAIVFASPSFADSEEEAEKSLALLTTCPVINQAIVKVPHTPTDLPSWYTAVMSNYLADHRYSADNMWTSAPAEDLLPGIRRIIATMPPHPSHFLWLNWGPSPARQDMAYSLEAEIYLACYGGWMDASDDEKYADWARSNMAAMAHLASGIQLADENLGQRPAKFVTDENMARLDKVRATYDPENRFYSWMGRI